MDLVRPDSGSIVLFGREGGMVEARRRIGFLPEQPYYDLYLTPRKLLGYYGSLAGLSPAMVEARTAHLLSLVGLDGEADLAMSRFSKGMLQRVGLAQSLIAEPEFLILDEPSAGLDPLGKVQVRDLLQGLKENGISILLSSHQLSEIEEICDDVAIIDHGRNLASGPLEDLLRSKEEYEIVLESAPERPPTLPRGASWMDAEKKSIVVGRDGVSETLQALLQEKALIEEVRARRMTLEEFFLSRVGEERPGSDK
jgi:ABC-2 type transport system ATP-binding protein